MSRSVLTFAVGLVCLLTLFTSNARGADRYNVLFIAVDDLRPELGCYGAEQIVSPNIDKLAASGIVFNRAYCQQAVCSPSRTSLLTGLRPDSTKIYDLNTHFRITNPDVVTLPQHFKNNGYETRGLGKLYHGGLGDPKSWSKPHWHPMKRMYNKPESLAILEASKKRLKASGQLRHNVVLEKDPKTGEPLKIKRVGKRPLGPAWEDPEVADNELGDGALADEAIRVLGDIKDQSFFLAVGFFKPHLPFVAPKKYFDLYPPEQIHLSPNRFPPVGVPNVALHTWGELRSYSDIPPVGPVTDAKAIELIRAYYASVSFIDAQIGRVIDELDRLGLRDNTVIVLWGDHGWHLGEQGLWCKHSNFEIATRVPMLFSVPGQASAGAKTDALSEFVDIYPTLCELCDLPLPDGLEGASLTPVIDKPDRPWKTAAFSQYPRGRGMGYSMRTERYRFTEWGQPGEDPIGVELYDYVLDPAGNINLAHRPQQAELVKQLREQLHKGWQAAKPPTE